jgi:hypothetical protein
LPLLVLQEADGTRGRVATLATSLSPPWSGGLTGWGERLLEIGGGDQVGDRYATLVMNLVRWVAGEETLRRPLPSWDELVELPAMETHPNLRVL